MDKNKDIYESYDDYLDKNIDRPSGNIVIYDN